MAKNLYRASERTLERIGKSHVLSPRNFQYACAISGVLCSAFFFFAFVAAGFLPPTNPRWSADQTVAHYLKHEKGIRTGSAMMLLSGMFYLPLTAAISAQMRRIPNLHYAVSALQLASGAAGIFTFMMPGMILGVAAYRLERPAEITQAFNDLFWITALMPWPTFMSQNFAFAYAILIDQRPNPLFPKFIAVLNLMVPILFAPAIAMHCVRSGPLAWNGGMTFWMAGSIFCIQLVIDSLCLYRAIRSEPVGGERIVDIFPSSGHPKEENTKQMEDVATQE
ncbi:hypothetical protein LARI1_G004263 [Lachnellula arida]|uniref:Integral membrane protein n=1 Tax=Lachnellula arida TaxID=1316785 RepID=A0A8T9BIN0_9HELO|nr:hypothetical protein LARI1_G004263 [Lachnellula arida]